MALRRGGWRWPALFALVVALVSGINATAIIYVGVAPVLWLLYAVAVLREATWRQAIGTGLRIGILTLGACVWWMAGLLVEAAYGVNVLKYTETVPSTSATSNPSEVIRGLGYWYFYGGDSLGPWTNSAARYTQAWSCWPPRTPSPSSRSVAAAFVRWRERAYFIVLIFVGLILSVGPFPFSNPTTIGRLLQVLHDQHDGGPGPALDRPGHAGRAPRPRHAARRRAHGALGPRITVLGLVTAFLLACLVVGQQPFDLQRRHHRQLPLDPRRAALLRDAGDRPPQRTPTKGPGCWPSRATTSPSYRWGDPLDTPQPADLTRDFVTREQQVMGSIATADTLYAIDDPIQEDTENYNALAPMARLMSAGDLMVEYDQRYEHYGVPQPQLLALQLLHTPSGLSDPVSFGAPRPNISAVSTLDEQDLSAPATIDVAQPGRHLHGQRPAARWSAASRTRER